MSFFFPLPGTGGSGGECGCNWNNLPGRPSVFNPAPHSHADTYMPLQGIQLEQNSIHNDALPSAYPMGPSWYSVDSNQLGNFPFPSGMIFTERWLDGRIRQTFSRITGETWRRFGANNLWTGGGNGAWIPDPPLPIRAADETQAIQLSQANPNALVWIGG